MGFGVGKNYIRPPKTLIKTRTYELELTKIKKFCSPRDLNRKVKWLITEWEKIYAIHISPRNAITDI